MNRDEFIQNLHYLSLLLKNMQEKGEEKLKESKEIRKLLKLPQTVHNTVKLNNYLKNGTEQKKA